MTDNTQLQEFNRLLVEALLPSGKRGRSRLFLTTDHIGKLSQKRGVSEEAFIHELYEVAIAQDLCTGLEEQIKNYQAILSKLPGKIKNDGKIPINQSDFDQTLNDLQVQIIPPFFIYLVVIVHAYMSGEREDVDPIANSYPGYIITGDRVKLLEKCPVCGKSGSVLESDVTRMAGAEAKGCANLMRGLMAEEFKKAEKK